MARFLKIAAITAMTFVLLGCSRLPTIEEQCAHLDVSEMQDTITDAPPVTGRGGPDAPLAGGDSVVVCQ